MSLGKNKRLDVHVEIDKNCYWDVRTSTPDFHGMSFAEWKN
jgi:hypothetical protein